MALRFINVDLDIESKHSLDYLCLELSASGIRHLHSGPSGRGYFARLECADGGDTCEPDSIINKFCGGIESLDERAATEWNSAHHRCFDLGYESSESDLRWSSNLRHSTLSRLVALGASMTFSVYPLDKNEQPIGGLSSAVND